MDTALDLARMPLPMLLLIPNLRGEREKEAGIALNPIPDSAGEPLGLMTGEVTMGDGDVVLMAIREVSIVVLIVEGCTSDFPFPHRSSSNPPFSR